ncbi:MAG: hypothetical protein ACLQO7_02665 [Candidatus Bathyarchaeia archaeon]
MVSDYQLQVVFEPNYKNAWSRRYRFAVIDPHKLSGYPANFVCILPKKIFDSGKPLSEFGRIFGQKSSELAIDLLKDALKQENDEKVKVELKKRLEALELERPQLFCSCCHKEFEQYSRMKCKRRLCKICFEKRLLQIRN